LRIVILKRLFKISKGLNLEITLKNRISKVTLSLLFWISKDKLTSLNTKYKNWTKISKLDKLTLDNEEKIEERNEGFNKQKNLSKNYKKPKSILEKIEKYFLDDTNALCLPY